MVLKYDINLLFRFFMNVHDSCSCFNLMQDQTKILFVSRFFICNGINLIKRY